MVPPAGHEAAAGGAATLMFAGEARKLEEWLGQAAMGCSFLLQGGDYAESFEDFGANSIHDMFRLMLQMAVVLSFDGQMPPVKNVTGTEGQHELGSASLVYSFLIKQNVMGTEEGAFKKSEDRSP